MIDTNLVEANIDDTSPRILRSRVASALIASLSTHCRSYCILTGYDDLPRSFDSDIDFIVDAHDFDNMPALIADLARQSSTHLFRVTQHEISARAFLLVSQSGVASQSGAELTFISPDSSADYRHYGSLWLRSGEVLATRRWHPNGFWIPSASCEFIYYLIKRMNKRDLSTQQVLRLHRLYKEDPHGCDRMLARYWLQRDQVALQSMAASGVWDPMLGSLESFRRELMQHSIEKPMEKLASIRQRAGHFLDRVLRPTGAWIAFMGPDGCGKSSVIDAIAKQFAPAFREVKRFHMQPNVLVKNKSGKGSVTDPHGMPPRGFLASIAKVFYYLADYTLGYLLRIRPAMIRTQLVIFDRYFYDLLIDNKRVRYGGPQWLLRFAAKLMPRPELVILLSAPPEVLWSRKQEVPFDEVVRQQAGYYQLAQRLPSAVIVDASQSLPAVIHDCAGVIISHFAHRTAARLEINN